VFLKVARALRQNDFTGRTNMCLEQMATVGGTVLPANYGMRVHNRLSVLQGDVANERQEFHLFVERDRWFILLALPAEPPEVYR
jgi:hypothetical protein